MVSVDPRGTGASDPAPEQYRLRQRAEDLRATIEALSCGPVIPVGISSAGCTVAWLAYDHPELVEKLVLVGTPPAPRGWNQEVDAVRPPRPKSVDQQWKRWFGALEAGDFSEFDDFITAFAYSLFTESDSRDLAEDYIRRPKQLPQMVWRNFVTDSPDDDIVPLLGQLRTPTLVAHGTADRRVPFPVAPFMVKRIPAAQLYAFEGKGHLPPFTAPQEFCQVLQQFARTGTLPERGAFGLEGGHR